MNSLTMIELGVVLPELFLACAAMALLMAGVFSRGDAAQPITTAAIVVLIVAGLLVLSGNSAEPLTVMNGVFRADGFGSFMKILSLMGSALALILSIDFFRRQGIARFEYPVLVLFATLGMLMMISANDLMSLYVGLELQSLSLYVVASFHRDDVRSTEAGLKYFVLGALSSGMLLYGASLVYGFVGTTNFDDIAKTFVEIGQPPVGVVFGLVFVIAGLAFKISAVPFHMWTPDVYEGAPTPVTAFFSVAPKVAAIALITRVLIGPFGDLVQQWQQVVVFVSMASMVLGSFAAINQSNIKRLMAYSSIGNMGYALVGLAPGSHTGVIGVAIYMAIYLAMSIGTFACILAMRVNGKQVEEINDLSGLSKTHPMMALALAIFMFSMAGIPPMAGFFSKLYVFLAAVEGGLYGLAVVGVLASVVGAYYYLRIVKLMYFDAPKVTIDPMGRDLGVITAVTGVFTLLFFVFPAPLLSTAEAAAKVLFPG